MSTFQVMESWRYQGGNTSDNCTNLCSLIARPGWTVRLYASPVRGSELDESHSGPDTNFPLLVALATEDFLPGIARFAVVMDGRLLTARRPPRAAEVRTVLDTALQQQEGKVLVSFGGDTARAPFTAGLPVWQASSVLAGIPTAALTQSNRAPFWSMLSMLSEAEHFANR